MVRTSTRIGKLQRLADMVHTTWTSRRAYDLAHVDVFSGAAFVWAETVCFELARLGRPYVLTLRGGNLPAFLQRWPRRTRRLLRSAAAVTAPSAYLQEALASDAKAILTLPNAIDVPRHPFAIRVHPGARMVWLRAFHRVYNPAMAVDVLAGLQKFGATLTMIGVDKGDGSLEAVRARAQTLGVEDKLELITGVPKADVPTFLSRADVFLNTTDVDNSPVSVLEAMACGLCVVSTNVGGIPSMLRHERNSMLVPPRDPRAMVEAVERVLTEPPLGPQISAGAREHALGCDWRPILDRWEMLFDEVLKHA